MVKLFFSAFISLIILLTGCNGNSSKSSSKKMTYADLVEMFEDIQFDTLHVWSKCDKPNGNKFQGKQLDTTFFSLFGDYTKDYKQFYTDPKTNITKYSGDNLYSTYKFKINDVSTGLIIRCPSEYEESAIALWIYDGKKNELTKSIDLADGFGDENWYFNKDSWILKTTGGFSVITRQRDHEINEETSVDSLTSDKFEFYLLSSGEFVKKDTIVTNKDVYKLLCE